MDYSHYLWSIYLLLVSLLAVIGGLDGNFNHDDIVDLLDGLDNLNPTDLCPVVDDSLEHIVGNQNSSNGYLEMSLLDDTVVPPPMEQFSSLLPDPSRRESIVEDIVSWGLRRPDRNPGRNLV